MLINKKVPIIFYLKGINIFVWIRLIPILKFGIFDFSLNYPWNKTYLVIFFIDNYLLDFL